MNQEKTGLFIMEQRKAHNLTQQELADRVGVTNKAVSKWEKGRSMPDVALFEPLCRELEISVAELLAGRKIEEEAKQTVTEQMLIEEIGKNKLVGLQIFLMFNVLISMMLINGPLLIPMLRPYSILFVALGVIEAALTIYFDIALPARRTRQNAYLPSILYAIALFATLGIISYVKAEGQGIELSQILLSPGLPCLAVIAGTCIGTYARRRREE